MSSEILGLEAQWEREELEAHRLEMERRFSPPAGACPYGCDGSGWVELDDCFEPVEVDILWRGGWWTPCECNIATAWFSGDKYPRRYPDDYGGQRLKPKPPIAEEIHARFEGRQ